MAYFHEIINVVSFSLNIVGAAITIWGMLLALFDFFYKEIFDRKNALKLNESIRLKLGSYLVLSLEVFIAGDIVKTVTTPSWEALGMLGAIVVIRTVLSFFLTKDISINNRR